MERKIGEVFNDGEDKIKVVESTNCIDCYYKEKNCCNVGNARYDTAGYCALPDRRDNNPVKFIKIGESKMETKKHQLERLLKSIAEMKQREVDNKKTLEEMQKEVENLQNQIKEEEQPTVSATGVYLNNTMDYLYSLDCDNSILYQLSSNNNIDIRIKKLNINNAFENENSAKQEALRREGQEFIRRCAMLWNKSNDWRKIKNIIQYCIRFNGYKLEIDYFSNNQYGQPFFDTRELAERCIKELKAKYNEEQQKVIFGVK